MNMGPIHNGYRDSDLCQNTQNGSTCVVSSWLDHTSSRNVWQATFTLDSFKMNCRTS